MGTCIECDNEVCGCSSKLSSLCVIYKGVDLDNIGASTDENLESILIGLDAVLLNLYSLVASNPIGINVGGGVELFIPATADFRTFQDSSSITWSNTPDNVIAELSAAWYTANIQPILDDITTIQADIVTIQGNITTLQGNVSTNTTNITGNSLDIADIRTTQGTSDGDTNLGLFAGTTITDNVSVKVALQELETALEALSGEANTAANVGTGVGQVFRDKTGVTLNLKTLLKAVGVNNYIQINNLADEIEFDFDYAGLLTALDSIYVNETDEKSVASVGAGAFDIFKGLSGTTEEIKTVDSSPSVTVNDVADVLSFEVNETWLTDTVTTLISDIMTGQGSAKGYLFSAKNTNEQEFAAGVPSQNLIFEDDSSTGYYDYSNSWTMSRWVADSDAATDGDVEFVLNGKVEIFGTPAGAESLTFTIFHDVDAGGSPTALGTASVSFTAADSSGTQRAFYTSVKISDPGGIVLADGDKVYIQVTANTLTVDSKLVARSVFYNLEI